MGKHADIHYNKKQVVKAKTMKALMRNELLRIQSENDPSKVRETMGFIACMNLFIEFYGDLLNQSYE